MFRKLHKPIREMIIDNIDRKDLLNVRQTCRDNYSIMNDYLNRHYRKHRLWCLNEETIFYLVGRPVQYATTVYENWFEYRELYTSILDRDQFQDNKHGGKKFHSDKTTSFILQEFDPVLCKSFNDAIKYRVKGQAELIHRKKCVPEDDKLSRHFEFPIFEITLKAGSILKLTNIIRLKNETVCYGFKCHSPFAMQNMRLYDTGKIKEYGIRISGSPDDKKRCIIC